MADARYRFPRAALRWRGHSDGGSAGHDVVQWHGAVSRSRTRSGDVERGAVGRGCHRSDSAAGARDADAVSEHLGCGGREVMLSIRWFGALVLVALAFAAKKPGDDTSNPAYKDVTVVLTADPSGKPAKPAGFVHPGILVNRAQLDEIRRRVAAGIEPQKSAFEVIKASKWGARDYTPHPRETVECGSNSNPDFGCKDEQGDS